jgi:hypothetical protein
MRLWLLVAVVCIVQEFTTTNAVLLTAYHAGYSLWIIHAMYAAGTVIDFFAGYWFGLWVYRRTKENKLGKWAERFVQTYVLRLGSIGKRYILFIIGALNFTAMDSFIVPWMEISVSEAFIILFSANMLWYAFQWAFVLGINFFFPSPLEAVIAVIIISLVGVVAWKVFFKRLLGRW